MELVPSPLLPEGFKVPSTRWRHGSARLRELLTEKPYVFGPGVYDPHGAQLVMYHGFDAVYFSGYSFAVGHLGTTDMDLYSSVEIADGVRRTVSGLRKFQLTMAVGDQVMPKRCGHIAGKALVSADEMVGKLKMMRNVADDLGHADFIIIARTDGVSATEAPESTRGIDLAIERGLRYMDSGVPDLLWCEFPTAARGPVEQFTKEIRKRFPDARFAFNYSSSFKWQNEKDPMTFNELGEMGVGFLFITLAMQHAAGNGMSEVLTALRERREQGYIELQRREWDPARDVPTKSHHLFTGVPYHHHVGETYRARGMGAQDGLAKELVV